MRYPPRWVRKLALWGMPESAEIDDLIAVQMSWSKCAITVWRNSWLWLPPLAWGSFALAVLNTFHHW